MSNGAGACKVLRAKLSLFLLPLAIFAAAPSGEAVYQRRCSRCHEQTSPRLPHREALQQMPLARILRALASSAMMSISFTMSREDRIAVASYQGTDASIPGSPAPAFCAVRSVKLVAATSYLQDAQHSTTSAVFGENKVHFGALLSWAKQEGLEA
jgi:hypothetical protein